MNRKIHDRLCLSVLASLLALAAATGCAPRMKTEKVVWPFPPDVARIKYVRSLSTSSDFESGLRHFWNSLAGKSPLVLLNPTAVALSPDERRLYVTNSPVGLVTVFDFAKGTLARAANVNGFKPKRPFGIALDGDENLYVGDQAENLVWVYSAKGDFVRQIGKGMFERPVGVAFDRRRQMLYVVDGGTGTSMRHRVEVFAPDGRHLRTIGSRGDGPGQFNFPSYAAVAPDGKLYVADTSNFRIEIFDADGGFVTMFGAVGEGPALFGKVKGMAFDTFGNLYVVDGQVGIVQMFSPSLQPLMAFGGNSGRREYMNLPTDVVIDSKNNIYVADYAFSHVNQYALINTSASDSEAAGAAPGAAAAPAPSDTGPRPSAAAPSPAPAATR